MDQTAVASTNPQPKPKALTDEEREIAELMVWGLPNDETIRGTEIEAGWPLNLEQAAIFVGYRAKRARGYLSSKPEFRTLLASLVNDRRKDERGRNLARAIKIRDTTGEGLAADRTVQLKAIAVIEGTEGKSAVVVNVNQQNNTATISPGYVIKLRSPSNDALPAPNESSSAITVEGNLDREQHVMIEQEAE